MISISYLLDKGLGFDIQHFGFSPGPASHSLGGPEITHSLRFYISPPINGATDRT